MAALEETLVGTSLDGGLLSEDGRSPAPAAAEALAFLRTRRVPVVLTTSRTEAEVAPLAQQLGINPALIVEGGGELIVPPGHLQEGNGRRMRFGVAREYLSRALQALARATGATVRAFASTPPQEIARVTELSPEAAALAAQRHWDEPFLLDAGDADALAREADARGLRVTAEGRFFHLSGQAGLGLAVEALVGLHAHGGKLVATLALGDHERDLPLLSTADRAIIIPTAAGTLDPALKRALPEAECAPYPGPAGWNLGVLATLSGKALPHVQ